MKHLLIIFLLFISMPAHAELPLIIEKAYAYPTSKMQSNGAVFMQIQNLSNTPEKIISGHTEAAERIELHTHAIDGDIMMMREVDGYVIPESGKITLEPTGHHIMLMGLKKQLIVGETFDLYLQTETPQGEYIVNVVVGHGTFEE